MIIILSPAKTLDFDTEVNYSLESEIEFPKKANEIVSELKNLSKNDLQKLMKVNNDIADLNYQRYLEWKFPFDENKAKQAIFAFKGHVFQGLNITDFDYDDLKYTQNHLRILSGLYGVLKPLDKILAYRLEMGTKIKIGKNKNLYDFWSNSIKNNLEDSLKGHKTKTIVNLASDEYSKAAQLNKIGANIITPVFKDYKNGNYKVISVYAKMARGMMTSFILKNRIDNIEDIKHFDAENYYFNSELSTENEFVFTRN
jgi:cytoplasmic iron level regulating protein YaaA (DUF328/UPF0246 family)